MMRVLLGTVALVTVSAFTSSPASSFVGVHPNNKHSIHSGTNHGGTATASSLHVIKIPNPFGGGEDDNDSGNDPAATVLDPEVLVSKAKAVLASDLGLRDSSLLIDDFRWIGGGGNTAGKALNKEEYLAACRFFDLRTAFPDLDYRAHDFRSDASDPNTVRLTARTVGTLRGPLRLRRETLPPNGKRMICPPEAISMTFDPVTGKLQKLCSAFTTDRLVGNTNGLCGVMAAAAVAGAPPSEWETYPPVNVVTRFFGRPVKQLDDDSSSSTGTSASSFLAPFPETVMIQLAKGVIAADNGATDPDLLADDFTFCGPIVGPIPKNDFVKAFGGFDLKGGLPDLDADYANFRVDPYDPYRVWVDARGSGTRTGVFAGGEPTGLRYEGPPEAASFTFDDDGFCTRLTAGAVMDPTRGNTGGLGGVFGILYATGTPFPGIVSRPLPELLYRLQQNIFSPFTKISVDSYGIAASPSTTSTPASNDDTTTSTDPAAPKPMFSSEPPTPPVSPVDKAKASLSAKAPPESKPSVAVKAPSKPQPTPKAKVSSKPPVPAAPKKKKPAPAATKDDTPAPATGGFASFFGGGGDDSSSSSDEKGSKSKTKVGLKKQVASGRTTKQAQGGDAAAKAKQKKVEAAAKAKAEKAEAAARAKAEKANAAARAKEEKVNAVARAKEEKAEAAKKKASTKKPPKGKPAEPKVPPKKKAASKPPGISGPPKGVPSLAKWRKNDDGSLTGNVFGSSSFKDGKQITTSEIKSGTTRKNQVVVTTSGSRYYLE